MVGSSSQALHPGLLITSRPARPSQQFGVTHYGGEGSSNFVAHIRQELTLCAIRFLGLLARLIEGTRLSLEFFALLVEASGLLLEFAKRREVVKEKTADGEQVGQGIEDMGDIERGVQQIRREKRFIKFCGEVGDQGERKGSGDRIGTNRQIPGIDQQSCAHIDCRREPLNGLRDQVSKARVLGQKAGSGEACRESMRQYREANAGRDEQRTGGNESTPALHPHHESDPKHQHCRYEASGRCPDQWKQGCRPLVPGNQARVSQAPGDGQDTR